MTSLTGVCCAVRHSGFVRFWSTLCGSRLSNWWYGRKQVLRFAQDDIIVIARTLFHEGRLVSRADLGRRPEQSVQGLQLRQLRAAATQGFTHGLSRNIPHQGILRKRAAAQSAESGIEAAAFRPL